jgi:hypothetical protein
MRNPNEKVQLEVRAAPLFSPANLARNRNSKSPGAATVSRLETIACNLSCWREIISQPAQFRICAITAALSKSDEPAASISRRMYLQFILLMLFLRDKLSFSRAEIRVPG